MLTNAEPQQMDLGANQEDLHEAEVLLQKRIWLPKHMPIIAISSWNNSLTVSIVFSHLFGSPGPLVMMAPSGLNSKNSPAGRAYGTLPPGRGDTGRRGAARADKLRARIAAHQALGAPIPNLANLRAVLERRRHRTALKYRTEENGRRIPNY